MLISTMCFSYFSGMKTKFTCTEFTTGLENKTRYSIFLEQVNTMTYSNAQHREKPANIKVSFVTTAIAIP